MKHTTQSTHRMEELPSQRARQSLINRLAHQRAQALFDGQRRQLQAELNQAERQGHLAEVLNDLAQELADKPWR